MPSSTFVWIVVELNARGGIEDVHDVVSTARLAAAARRRLEDQGMENLTIWCWQVNGEPQGSGSL